jgi:dihydrofolate synthase/folylpolyglutamate synthase
MKAELLACQKWLEERNQSSETHDDFIKIANKYNLLSKKSKVITVGGTNGKGTTVACLEAILLAAGYRVATFTSPHLVSINERCRFNGRDSEPLLFIEAFNQVKTYVGPKTIHWFEFLLLSFLVLCQQVELDYILLEVGLGGRLCVTNCIEPDISVVTTVDLDHVARLGGTREAIGYQKAGIFRADKPAICGDPNPPQSLLDYALGIKANFLIQNKNFHYEIQDKHWSWQGTDKAFTQLPLPEIPLQNASTALAVLQFCSVSDAAIIQGLGQIQIKGRWQCFQTAPMIIGDVAHNPQACAYLADKLASVSAQGQTYAIVGMKVEKDIINCLRPLIPLVKKWFLMSLPGEENFIAIASGFLAEEQVAYEVGEHLVDALKKAQAISEEDDRITVFGSFQLVGKLIDIYESGES